MAFFGGLPFGFPGGAGRGRGQEEEEEDPSAKTKYYDVLGVSPKASDEQIRKAYKELAKKHHPDRKGGNAVEFQKVSEAYEILGDAEKKRMYDKFGPKAFENGGSGGMGGQGDLFDMLFNGGGGGGRRRQQEKPKVKPTKAALETKLEDLYSGKLIKYVHKRMRICPGCNGKGGQNAKQCQPCRGQGRVMKMAQVGPGMYTQVQQQCSTCKGEGTIIPEGGKCKKCNTRKIYEQQVTIEVPLPKGAYHGCPITLTGEGSEIPDALAGDLIMVVQEQKHDVFTRKGADLYIKKSITLIESLRGFTFNLKHLDGTQYTISTTRGEVVGDSDQKMIRGKGMPFYKDETSHGNLIIEFSVIMPESGSLTKDQAAAIAAILGGNVIQHPQEYDMLEAFNEHEVNTNEEGGRKVEEEGEEEEEGHSSWFH